MARACAGEPRALEQLLARERPAALRIAGSIVRDAQEAEDVVQSACLRVARALRAGQRPRAFGPWFRTIVTHLARNAVRDRLRRADHEARFGDRRGRLRNHSPHDSFERTEWLERQLARLPDETREAIELRYLGGHSYREISERLRWPEGTVVSRIRRGLERLRTQLADAGLPVALPVLERWLRELGGAGAGARGGAESTSGGRAVELPSVAGAPSRRTRVR
ncbi:MAG: RNA polymerase sigma factor, partial [Planctomycetota bacterium]